MTGSSMPACTACASARSSALSDRRRLTWGRITYHLRWSQVTLQIDNTPPDVSGV